jgi:hypothetical protein
LPSVDHPVFGGLVKRLLAATPFTHNVMDISIGYTPLFLASYGIFRWFKHKSDDRAFNFSTALFVTIAITALLLSFPPFVKVGGSTVYLPSYIMYFVAPMFKSVARYGVVIMCAVSVLAGVGLTYLLNGKTGWRKVFVITALVGLILFEFQNSNTRSATRSYEIPEVYRWLAARPGNSAIAEYPSFTRLDYRSLGYAFFQRIHEKPMFNGTPERGREDAIRISIVDLTTPGVPEMLDFLGIEHVIVHEDYYEGLGTTIPLAIDGLKLVKRFDNERVYEVIAESKDIMILPHGNFYPIERNKEGGIWRWLRDSAHVNFFNASEETVPVRIGFAARSFRKDRWLSISYEKELVQKKVPASEAVRLELDVSLQPGSNFFRFYTDVIPDEMAGVSGTKDISIYIGDLQVRTADGAIHEGR